MRHFDESPFGLKELSILLSILFHALLFWLGTKGFQKTWVEPVVPQEKVQWIDLQKMSTPKKIVDVMDTKSIVKDSVTSNLWSDENRKVQTQKVAPPSMADTFQPPSQSSPSTLSERLNLSDKHISKILQDTQTPYTISFNPNNYLPDIQVGDETMLSTQKFAYATYFNRMKQAIQVYWRPPSSLIAHNPSKRTWITQMLIVLDEKGELTNQQITQSSGIDALDHHAMMAVFKAAPFYNPPQVLLDEVGEIRMTWHFIFEQSRF